MTDPPHAPLDSIAPSARTAGDPILRRSVSSLRHGRLRFGAGERWAWTSALAYALVNVMLRAAAAHIDPWLGSLMRLLPMAALAWIIVAHNGFREFRAGDSRFLGRRFVAGLVFGGAVSYVLGNVFLFRALAVGGLAIGVNAVQGGSVWGGVILGALLLRERPRSEQIWGALIVALGLGVIALSELGQPSELWYEGLALAVIAGISYATANVFTRIVQRERPTLFGVLACSAAGGLVPLLLIVAGRLAFDHSGWLSGLRPYDVAVVLAAGCVNILALAAVAQAVRYTSVATANTIGSAQIVFSVVASVMLFDESVPALMVVGFIGVVVGILLGQTVRSRSGPAYAPSDVRT